MNLSNVKIKILFTNLLTTINVLVNIKLAEGV